MKNNKRYYEETTVETFSEIKGQQPNKKRGEFLFNGYSNQGACKVTETKDGVSNTRYGFINKNEITRTPVMDSQDIKGKDGIEAERKFNDIKEEVKQGIRGFGDRNFEPTNNTQATTIVNNNTSNNTNQNAITYQQSNNNQRQQTNNEEIRQRLTDQNNKNNYNNQELYNMISRFVLFYLFCSYVAYNNQQQELNSQSYWFCW